MYGIRQSTSHHLQTWRCDPTISPSGYEYDPTMIHKGGMLTMMVITQTRTREEAQFIIDGATAGSSPGRRQINSQNMYQEISIV